MNLELTPEQIESRKSFSDFVDEYIAPVADQYDRNEETPIELIKRLGEQGFLGAFIPEE
ncbi:MAG: acyl-CoA dehydrogenase family protein, partial [Candidatus Scalindua sp.]|nr:acyl-CoA dehydrogenase family protein [Candidatus Scalindua sp.]